VWFSEERHVGTMVSMARIMWVLKWLAGVGLLRVALRRFLKAKRYQRMLEEEGNGRSVLITGAAGGVGKETVRLFAEKRWRVFAVDVNSQGLESAKGELSAAAAARVTCLATDVTDPASCEKLFQEVESNVQGSSSGLDALVNCAAIALTMPALGVEYDRLNLQFQVNFLSVVRLTNLFHRLLIKGASGGAIVNVGSVGGVVCWPYQGLYSPSKFALSAFSDSVRREAKASGLNLRVTEVAPGAVNTPLAHNQLESSRKWIENNQDNAFVSGAKFSSDLHNSVPVETFAPVFMVTPQQVAESIYAAAADPNPPAKDYIMTPAFGLIFNLLRYLPTCLADRLVVCI